MKLQEPALQHRQLSCDCVPFFHLAIEGCTIDAKALFDGHPEAGHRCCIPQMCEGRASADMLNARLSMIIEFFPGLRGVEIPHAKHSILRGLGLEVVDNFSGGVHFDRLATIPDKNRLTFTRIGPTITWVFTILP